MHPFLYGTLVTVLYIVIAVNGGGICTIAPLVL